MTGGVLVVVLFVVFAWLRLFHSPRLVLRWACWPGLWCALKRRKCSDGCIRA